MSTRSKNSLPIEALSEYKVLEIASDGQEVLERYAQNFYLKANN